MTDSETQRTSSLSFPQAMAKSILTLSLCFLLIFSLTGHAILCSQTCEAINGMFVFGSSLVDNGNNNYLNTSVKADYSPYGIDFPLGHSGRFSNGRNTIDVLGELFRLPAFLPPFADPKTSGSRIVHGVNFASGGSGILDETGASTGKVMSLNKQILYFEKLTLPDLAAELKERNKDRSSNGYLLDYLFIIGTGGNDYLLNYFVSTMEQKPSLPKFTEVLISKLALQLKNLYYLGARKFALFSIQPLGCIPVVRDNIIISNGSCIEALNEAALLFNNLLKLKTISLKKKLPGSNIVFINSYNMMRAIIDNPHDHGFSDARRACCELTSQNGGILCKKGGITCSNRSNYVFFDGLHPTDAVNLRIATKAYSSILLEEVYPINLRKIACM